MRFLVARFIILSTVTKPFVMLYSYSSIRMEMSLYPPNTDPAAISRERVGNMTTTNPT